MENNYVDVLIIGAGLSGIDVAYQLQKLCPGKTYAILEARENIGGTWDFFRYPGIRSDSDMFTMGFTFRPWINSDKAFCADGSLIREYIIDTARESGIDKKILFSHKVIRASWSSTETRWTLEVIRQLPNSQEVETLYFSCNFLIVCAGYYKYNKGYTPDLSGVNEFKGLIVHPQSWPEDLNYAGKCVIVIGSGATAVTLVPTLAKTATHVTMLQRSPSYIVSLPQKDIIAQVLLRILPTKVAYRISRWKNVAIATYLYNWSRRSPERVKKLIKYLIRKNLGNDYDIETHFTPRYNPWDQRLCMVPNADLFKAIHDGRVTMVTDQIETFTPEGLKLKSGKELQADIIVTATGFELQFLGGIEVTVNGSLVDFSKAIFYKGIMCSNVPNLVSVIGYTNNSWTLKVDLIAEYVCKLLNYMDERKISQVTARLKENSASAYPLFKDFSPNYIQRGFMQWPKQGPSDPWRVYQNYYADERILRDSSLVDGTLEFVTRPNS